MTSGNGLPADQLRGLVREVLADVLAARGSQESAVSDNDAWTVRIGSDDELHAFVLRVLKLADNPGLRQDLTSGRARFRLAGTSPAAPARRDEIQRVEKGAVTERMVEAAARARVRLVLGPRAVITPLARDKARALGVPIEKER